jgi:Spy/CpxP family protein refolding chaperone
MVFISLMKTTITPSKTLFILTTTILPLAISSVSMAQTDPVSSPASKPAVTSSKHPHEHKALAALSDSERQQLKSDMKKIHQDPQFESARSAVKDAQTRQEKAAAKEALRQVKHDLLVKADPSIEPVLEKVIQAKKLN